MWSHGQRWISYSLKVRVVKYFHLLGVLSALIFILWGCCPMVLMSIFNFHLDLFSVLPRDCMTRMLIVYTCIMWSHDQTWDIVHLDFWSIKMFSSFGGFVRLDFYPLGLLSYGAYVHFSFSLSAHLTTWREFWLSTAVSCDHMTRDDMSYTLKVGVVKYFHLLGVLSTLIFILWGCCPMVLLSIFNFLCPPTWPHDENVDCPHLYHVITWPEMGYRTPWWLEGKILSSFGGFVCLDFYQVGLLSYGFFVHFGFSLSAHVTTWRECWLLFSVCPRDHMTRMLIVHTCIMWSHDQRWDIVHLDGWKVKYFHLGGFVRLDFIKWNCCNMVLLSILAFLCLPTCPHDENADCPHLYHVITWPEMGYRALWFLE